MKIFTWSFLFSVLFAVQSFGQDITVKGIVKEATTGDVIPGVNVIVEGTSIGTNTDFDGNYVITVPSQESVLKFSFIGMEDQSIVVGSQTVINVELAESKEMLDEVIVVAYGTTTKEAFTGAAEVVDNEVIQDRPVTSFVKSLQGTTAGLQVTSSSGQPGSGSQVRIRGIGSLSASSAPLYIIDGVPLSGGLSDINPNDIEKITVLKDAAASSLYGSRAANGVIIVTTKQGKSGETRISFDSQMGFSNRISEGYQLMNSTQIYEQSWMGLYNQSIIAGNNIEVARAYAHSTVEDIVGHNPFGVENPLDDTGKLIPGTLVETNTNWRDEIYKQGVINNHNLSVAGGNDDTKVFFSLGYFSDSGTTLSSDFKRYTSKLSINHKVNNFITAGMNTNVSFSETTAPPGGSGGSNPVSSAEKINSATPVYTGTGDYNWDNTAVFDFNPVGLAELDKYEYKGRRVISNGFLNFQILEDLSFRTTGGIDYSTSKGLNYYNPEHGNGAGVNGRSTHSVSENIAYNLSNILNWKKAFKKGDLELLAGQELYGATSTSLSASVTDFSIPGFTELTWGASPETPGSGTSEWKMISFLGQAKYNHNGKYYASASVRSDGSSRFGENQRYGLFYSVGGSWLMSQEDFMTDITWLNRLKIRASYGTSGNNDIGNYSSLGLYGAGFNYGGYPGLSPVQLENKNLTWEKIASFNVGLEARVFDKLSATFEFYSRESDGLLYGINLSAAKGIRSILANIGGMSNTGIEAMFNFDAVNNENFSYNFGINVSRNTNEILNLTTDKIKGATQILEEGGNRHQFYMREWAGVNPDNGLPMWYTNVESDDIENGNTQPGSAFTDPLGTERMVTSDYTDAERTRMGSALPDFYGGFNNSFTYKNFDLNFYFYFSHGGQIYNYNYAGSMHDGVNPGDNLSTEALNAWTPNNRFTNVPRYVTNNVDRGNQISSRFLEDGTYVRLKNISLGYDLPSTLLQKIKLQRLRAFVSGENLWTLTDFNGFDPEVSLAGTTSNNIPGVKTITFGLKVDL
ncbi:MAG: hypothetical protein BM563_01100 [Bacteroidetes bacterium MedPE-SWsnd-G1]|nr:MAG: hypothetical protein BM563_01100 [Bacteroidetes bacterium MedPE-SWsnd-G1]